MAKDKYEISVWEDIFVPEQEIDGNLVPGHYEEEKIAVIGSDTMTADCRAIEPKLICNVNGKVTFSFKMYYRYHDEATGEDYDNSFITLLVNERKIKVLWLNSWYDLVIKNIQESSNGKTVIYQCEDANINELAKTGFNLIFDDDLTLNNVTGGNQGTVSELVERTIEGTEWTLGNADNIQQFNEEAVFEIELTSGFTATNMQTSQSVNIPSTTDNKPTKILIYYPQLADFINNSIQTPSTTISPLYFAYDPEQKYSKLAQTEMLVQADCYEISSCNCSITNEILTFVVNNQAIGSIQYNYISTQYRANRLVSEPINSIEPVSGKSCYVHKVTAVDPSGQYADQVEVGDIVYESIGSEFGDALYATNLIANGTAFISTTGWEAPTEYPVSLTVYPVTASTTETRIVYLTIPAAGNSTRFYYNDAFYSNSQHFQEECKQGEVYYVRIKAKQLINGTYSYCDSSNLNLAPLVRQYQFNSTIGSKQPTGITFFRVDPVTPPISGSENWVEFKLTCTNGFTGSDIYRYGIGLFITQTANTSARYIEEIQLFKVVKDHQGNMLYPGELDKTGIINTVYNYFVVKNNTIIYLYSGFEDWNKQGITLVQKYNDNYSKVRSINIKQSNRFNILQTIAETFECWIRFDVRHDETGKIEQEIVEVEPGKVQVRPKKYITIRREAGEDRGIGFVYGIDLQSISRTIESSQIVTKTIVLENNNEFGENGTCRISRSKFNYPQIDYVLNFDYYVNHKMMDGAELNKDLYSRHGTYQDTQAFYANLHFWNTEYARLAEETANYLIAKNKDEGLINVYKTAIEAAGVEIRDNQAWITNMAGMRTYNSAGTQTFIAQYIGSSPELKGHVAAIESQTQLVNYYQDQVSKLNTVIATYDQTIKANQQQMDQYKEYIKLKTDLFNKKYAHFISEGSWTDQKYYDDNLYYLDANSVAYTSSRPKVSYNIAVMRLTSLEDFKIKDFRLGDISYVEDTDFFGYIQVYDRDQFVKTPYREKVVITEINYNFDEPSKDSFTVQNYRTQFEDLFQRITAQTQSLQYTVGAYNKVSNIIESDGTIKTDILASSVKANNNALNRSSINNSVVTDDQGITVTNMANTSEQVKITSGGIFITTNGGETWNNAVRGDGVGVQYLSSGSIDTKKITIVGENRDNEEAVAFKWDESGITAYDSFSIDPNAGQMYDKDRYVRFNKEGVIVQTTYTTQGGAPISYEKIRLGHLNNTTHEYGLQINSYIDNAVVPVFKATDDGNLQITGDIVARSLTLQPDVKIDSSSIDGLAAVATSGSASDVSGLATVATSGSFNDLSGKPNMEIYVAKDGTIGSTPASGVTGFKVSSDGLLQASNAVIYGSLYASGGTVGGFTIESNSIHTANVAITSNAANSVGLSSSTFTRTIDGTSRANLKLAIGSRFGVANDGTVYAGSAVISGTVNANGGSIGGFAIDSTSIHTNNVAITSNADNSVGLSSSTFTRTIGGTSRSNLKFAIGSGFGVSSDGTLYTNNARISGENLNISSKQTASTGTNSIVLQWTPSGSYTREIGISPSAVIMRQYGTDSSIGTVNNTTTVWGGLISVGNGSSTVVVTPTSIVFNSAGGSLYGDQSQNMVRLFTTTSAGYVTSGAIANMGTAYRAFILMTTRGAGAAPMATTVIPLAMAKTCNSTTEAWAYSAQNAGYQASCYFNFSNNTISLSNRNDAADNRAEVWGLR